ncbi:protein YIPF3-like isoform X1 [Mytilus californianus]|uniref:protein YIPF3-like isoform X1 n=1 Tax=Mytilus californianus TaxID=6549 RepID=UPI002245CBFC|nr:protein YIPF3-like isoform X1 [Mytilus californianus]
MADPSSWHSQNMSDKSAVIDLGELENEPDIDAASEPGPTSKKSFGDDMRQRLTGNVTEMLWNSGKTQAKKAWSLYGNIDILRPYFDVEPHEVRQRLLFSLLPQKPSDQKQRVPRELYGPLMVVFTMIALLLFQMKTAEHKVEEGTLMGTAFGVCFTYWIGGAVFVWVLSYISNVHIALLQIMSMMGYGLFGPCIVLFLSTIIHTSHDHLFFYSMWAIFGGLSSLRMISIILSRTQGKSQRLLVCGVLAALHLLFLIYLHFAYHQIVEELSEVFDSKPVVQQPQAKLDDISATKVTESVKSVVEHAQNIVKRAVNDTLGNTRLGTNNTHAVKA